MTTLPMIKVGDKTVVPLASSNVSAIVEKTTGNAKTRAFGVVVF